MADELTHKSTQICGIIVGQIKDGHYVVKHDLINGLNRIPWEGVHASDPKTPHFYVFSQIRACGLSSTYQETCSFNRKTLYRDNSPLTRREEHPTLTLIEPSQQPSEQGCREDDRSQDQ